MEEYIWAFFFILGMVLQYFFYITVPSYLAVKIIRALSPSLLEDSRMALRQWYDAFFLLILAVPLSRLLIEFGVDIILEIPTWASWVPEQLYHMYHTIIFPVPIFTFMAKIISILCFGKKFRRKN